MILFSNTLSVLVSIVTTLCRALCRTYLRNKDMAKMFFPDVVEMGK